MPGEDARDRERPRADGGGDGARAVGDRAVAGIADVTSCVAILLAEARLKSLAVACAAVLLSLPVSADTAPSPNVVGGLRRAPALAGKHPAVLMIGGIGCYALDGLLGPAKLQQPYAQLLDAWTRAGYVTMRVEKSGMGDS